jgi:hypothetical protein
LGTNIRNKYTYATCSSTAACVAVSSATTYGGAAAGNKTRGIFALGYSNPGGSNVIRNKYTYATCSSTACGVGSSSTASYRGSAVGDSTKGIFAMGLINSGSCPSTIRNKYTYSSCTNTACGVGAASAASYCGSAAGNSTRGIFALGSTAAGVGGTTTRNKYTYACCTSTATGVAASSNRTFGGSAASWATCVNS